MRLIFTLLTFLVLISCSDNPKNHWADQGLKGKVKTIVQKEYRAEEKFGEIVNGERDRVFGPDSTVYNEKGFVTEEYYFDDDQDWKPFRKWVAIYDESRLIEERSYNPIDVLDRAWKYDYQNNSKKPSSKFLVDEDGNKIREEVYTYDSNDNLIKTENYSNGELVSVITTTYNSDGLRTEINDYNADGERTWRFTFTYEGPHLKSEKFFHKDGLDRVLEYDPDGQLTKEISYDSYGEVESVYDYIYEKDSKGNWIKRLRLWTDQRVFDKEPTSITERTITYY